MGRGPASAGRDARFYFPGQGARCGQGLCRAGDVTRPRLTDEACPGVDTVIHCAAITDHVGDAALFERVNTQDYRPCDRLGEAGGASYCMYPPCRCRALATGVSQTRGDVFTERDLMSARRMGATPMSTTSCWPRPWC